MHSAVQQRIVSRRERLIFIGIALIGAFLITRGLVERPGFTDAFYHFNAANRLVSGEGLTDAYFWTYIGATDSLPAPSHLYWMPLTSIVAALGMVALNAPGSYAAAQFPLALLFAGTVYIGFVLGERLGGSRRHAWFAGLITLASGFYIRFWGATDTFAPYAFVGTAALYVMGWVCSRAVGERTRRSASLQEAIEGQRIRDGRAAERHGEEHEERTRRSASRPEATEGQPIPGILSVAFVGGMCSALGHLTRADGVLLVLVGLAAVLGLAIFRRATWRSALLVAAGLCVGYVVVMLPWFARNLSLIGTPLPLGGTQTIWQRTYDDIFNYPPDSSAASLFADGVGVFLSSRWTAFTNNLGTLVVVEGLVVMAPLMLIGLWRRRRDPFLLPFGIYALGLHVAMTVVFPFPGYRGGLLHSAAALVPWWAILGLLGLDDCIDWMARRRRWNVRTARPVFSVGLLGVAVALGVFVALPNRVVDGGTPALYSALADAIPSGSRVMINDPAQLYYYTGLGGVVLPNEEPAIILDIARKYQVDFVVMEGVTADGREAWGASALLWPLLTAPPPFLESLPFSMPDIRLYAIRLD
ncbi:MAG: hypothetical protein JNM70_08975 [Anaerolineae bacterium]|nr:hypothetical protein [Anaerolineae bacterium]